MRRSKLWILIAAAAIVLAWKGPQWLAFERGVRAYLYAYPLVIAPPRPKTRYPLSFLWRLSRILGDRALDRLTRSAMGL